MMRLERDLAALITVRTLGTTAFYGWVPFVAVWLNNARSSLSAIEIGTVVGILIVTTRGGALLLPGVVRKLGVRWTIAASYIAGASTFLLFITIRETSALWTSVLAACLGIAFAGGTLGIKVLAASHEDDAKRLRAFSLLNVATNLGAAIGPVIGSFLATKQGAWLPSSITVLLVVASISALAVQEPRHTYSSTRNAANTEDRALMADKGLLLFLILSSVTWLGYAQLFNVLPIAAMGTRMELLVPLIFTINAIIIISLQLFVSDLIGRPGRRYSDFQLLAFGNVLTAIGLAGFACDASVLWLAGILVFSFGEMVWSPLLDLMAVRQRGSFAMPMALAWSGVAWGIAESVGAFVGTTLALGGASTTPFVLGAAASLFAGLAWALAHRNQAVIRNAASRPKVSRPDANRDGLIGQGCARSGTPTPEGGATIHPFAGRERPYLRLHPRISTIARVD